MFHIVELFHMWSGHICDDVNSFADHYYSSPSACQHSFHINKYDSVLCCRTEQRYILYREVISRERSILLSDQNRLFYH